MLVSLTDLDLSKNRLRELPASVGALQNLRRLNLSENILEQLPRTFGECASLEDLDLSNNKLSDLPLEIQLLQRVTRVDLRFNQIEHPPMLAGATSLRELYLGSNRIAQLVNCGFAPTGLRILDVRDNKIKDLGPVIVFYCVSLPLFLFEVSSRLQRIQGLHYDAHKSFNNKSPTKRRMAHH
jgi:Leucine-rich repeat (LRR) protein